MKNDQTEGVLVISDMETLRVLTDPLRTQIVEMLILQPLTVRQTAERLGLAASRLYYHFSLLEKHGVIKVIETRMVANMVEKLYGAVARDISIDPSLLTLTSEAGKESVPHLLAATIDATREDLARSLQARLFDLDSGAQENPQTVVLTRMVARLTREQAAEFLQRLSALAADFDQEPAGADSPERQAYALTIAFYPSFYYGGEQNQTESSQPSKEGDL